MGYICGGYQGLGIDIDPQAVKLTSVATHNGDSQVQQWSEVQDATQTEFREASRFEGECVWKGVIEGQVRL